MDVFISWSGERSKIVAEALVTSLRAVLERATFWYSEELESGVRWSQQIADRLEKSEFGILVVTPENQEAPWLLFEAGAIAKSVAGGRVVPVLLGFEKKSDLKPGPLTQFQARFAAQQDIKRIVDDVNGLLDEDGSKEGNVTILFDHYWSGIEAAIKRALELQLGGETRERDPSEMIPEILDSVREIRRTLAVRRAGAFGVGFRADELADELRIAFRHQGVGAIAYHADQEMHIDLLSGEPSARDLNFLREIARAQAIEFVLTYPQGRFRVFKSGEVISEFGVGSSAGVIASLVDEGPIANPSSAADNEIN